MTPEEACTKAAEYIGEHGHTQNGRYRDSGGGVCAVGALATVTGSVVNRASRIHDDNGMLIDWSKNPAFEQARELLRAQAGLQNEWQIPEWNDDQASTEEVILALKRAGHG